MYLIVAVQYVRKQYGGSGVYLLDENGYIYSCYRKFQGRNYWRCKSHKKHFKCTGRAVTQSNQLVKIAGLHTHSSNFTNEFVYVGYESPDQLIVE